MNKIIAVFTFVVLFTGISIGTSSANSCDGLVAYYPFDGNANDESGNEYDGTVYGATVTSDRFGMPNSAYSFNGENNYIFVPDFNALDGKSSATYSFWINKKTIPQEQGCNSITCEVILISAGDFVSALAIHSTLAFEISRGNGSSWNSPAYTLSDNTLSGLDEWHHVAVVIDGTTETVYINGVLGSTKTNSEQTFVNWDGLYIGSFLGNRLMLDGALDEFRIYDRALNESDIQALYNMSPNLTPVAIAGTSLDGNQLQLDGSSSFDPFGAPLTFSWQIEGESTPRPGQIVNIADLAVGTYTVTLTLDNGESTSTDTMLFGVTE